MRHSYNVAGDPLTSSVSDDAGTITTKTDLLGRVVSYSDVHGLRTETTYDQAGRAIEEKMTPPIGTVQTSTSTYDDAGRNLVTTVDGVTLATAAYDAAGELASATYQNGTSLNAVGRDNAGRTVSRTWRTSDARDIVSTVTRSLSGTIIDESFGGTDARPGAPNYAYDAAGRLTEAWVTGHHYTYDYTSATPSGCPTGTVGNAGTNTNRIRLLDQTAAGTAETGYCHDAADRLLGTVGASAVTDVRYDTHGNTTQYTTGDSTTYLGWDSADRHLTARSTGPDPAEVAYTRDATDRIVRRAATQGDQLGVALYAHTGSGDKADVVLDGAKNLLSRSVSLPGGVLLTVQGATRTLDHPTVRGDLSLTTDATGLQLGGLRTYTPFGEPLATTGAVAPDNVPDNQPGQFDQGWLGEHQRAYEHAGVLSLVQMGARPYSPMLGRFLAVDPVEGGSANDYDYVGGDPVNKTDLDGNRCTKSLWKGMWCRVTKIRNNQMSVIETNRSWLGVNRVTTTYRVVRIAGIGFPILSSQTTCSGRPMTCTMRNVRPPIVKSGVNPACRDGFYTFTGGMIGLGSAFFGAGGWGLAAGVWGVGSGTHQMATC